MKHKQETLFPLPPEQETESIRRWYYVVNPREDSMLVLPENEDRPQWATHELQHNVPYLWNFAPTARADLKRWEIKGIVKLYPYTSPWWQDNGNRKPLAEGSGDE